MPELPMKCEVCLQLLEEYIDGELREAQAAPINAHLVTCASCGDEFEALNVKSTDLLAAATSKRAKNLLKPNISFKPSKKVGASDQSDVLFSDMAYSAVEEQETQAHLENAQNLLRSVRNIEISEDDSEVDVS